MKAKLQKQPVESCHIENGLLYHTTADGEQQLYIPDAKLRDGQGFRARLLYEYHDSNTAGHFGMDKTYHTIKHGYYWPEMRDLIRDYVASCDLCQVNKAANRKPFGKAMQSLANPPSKLTHWSMDLDHRSP